MSDTSYQYHTVVLVTIIISRRIDRGISNWSVSSVTAVRGPYHLDTLASSDQTIVKHVVCHTRLMHKTMTMWDKFSFFRVGFGFAFLLDLYY